MASDSSLSLTSLRRDFELIRRNEEDLPAELYYIAGVCQSLTGLTLPVLYKFMSLVCRAKKSREVGDEDYLSICGYVKEGRIGDAKGALEVCRVASMNSIRAAMPNERPKPLPVPIKAKEQDIAEVVRKLELEENRKEAEAKRKSEELARQLQAQYQREVEAMAEEQARANMTCQKCRTYAQAPEVVQECGHVFHAKCLEERLSIRVREGVFPLACPSAQCRTEITFRDIRCIPTHLRQWFSQTQQGFQHFNIHPESMVTCPTTRCSYRLYFQGNTDFYCPSCSNRYCLRCRAALHPGRACEELKTYLTTPDLDRMFAFMKLGATFKACPSCTLWNLQLPGQTRMTCLCGTVFCTLCGIRGSYCHCAGRQFAKGF